MLNAKRGKRNCHAECISAKHLLKNTAIFAKVALADILETVRRCFTSLRFVQQDNGFARFALFSIEQFRFHFLDFYRAIALKSHAERREAG